MIKKYSIFHLLILSFMISIAQPKAKIGMSLNEVKKIIPEAESGAYENTITLSLKETLYGIDGEWGYRFEDSKLNWIYYNKYYEEINAANFNKCLFATRQILKDYTKSYGKPDELIVGDTTFVDPYVKHHWGYDVMEARWKNHKDMKIKLEFTFMGSKGIYYFLVKINYFDKDYLYFD